MLREYAQALKALSFRQWVENAGVVGLFVFAFGMLFKKSVAHTGILLMTLSLGLSLKSMGKKILRDRLLLLSIAFFVFLVVRTVFASFEFPEYKPLLIEGAFKLLGSGFFLAFVTAYWMHRTRDKWDWVLIVFVAGYLVQILRQMDWANLSGKLQLILTGAERPTFGFSTNRFGLFSAIVFLACLLLYRQFWGPADKAIWRKARMALWGILSLVSVWGLTYSQSRSAWFASAIVFPIGMVCKLKQAKKIKLKAFVLTALLFLVIAVAINLPRIIERRLGSGIDSASIIARLSLYTIAWDNWKTHPFFGVGPGTSWIMIQQAGKEHAAVKSLDHLHNFVLDVGAQLGIIGIAFFTLSFYLVIRQALRANRGKEVDRNYTLFTLSAIGLILLTGIPNQPLSSPHGVYLIGFLGGMCYSSKFTITNALQTTPSQ